MTYGPPVVRQGWADMIVQGGFEGNMTRRVGKYSSCVEKALHRPKWRSSGQLWTIDPKAAKISETQLRQIRLPSIFQLRLAAVSSDLDSEGGGKDTL